jgi:uncharacterized spore protein YtfJ
MNVPEVMTQVRDAISVKRVVGEPYEKNGTTVIPVASISGVGGAGEGQDATGHPTGGGGYGMGGRTTGAYVIRGDKVRWLPAVDVNRLMLGMQIVAIVALFTARSIAKERARVALTRDDQDPRPVSRQVPKALRRFSVKLPARPRHVLAQLHHA